MTPTTNAERMNRVFYLGADQALIADLAHLLAPSGLQIAPFEDAYDLVRELADAAPEVAIVETAALPEEDGLAKLVAELHRARGQTHVICIAREDQRENAMEARLAAVRAGAASYLGAPVSPRRLAARVLRMCGVIETTRYRILILDQDARQAKKIAALLASIGMETLVVDAPMKLLARMQAFRPNLVLMSLHLAEVTGSELAKIIRDHDDFYGIPILFLSEEDDLNKQLAALKAGGDGFIHKPVKRAALIAAVEYRMRMSRWLQDRRTLVNRRETASGFLPRDVFMRHLEQIAKAGAPQSGATALILVDLDEHQRILTKLGLTATEKLLRELEGVLSKVMVTADSATRMDDFRYGLLMTREDASALELLATSLCQQIADLEPEETELDIAISASLGVGFLDSPSEDAITMVARAEKGVAGARAASGNQVHVWSSQPKAGAAPEAESVLKRLVSAALAQDGFLLLFQPVLALNQSDGELYEAQIRMQTLDGEQVPPADFLSVAERSEMMPRVDRWVLRRAFDVMSAQRKAHPGLKLLVHQSVGTLSAPEWFPWFRDQILKRNLTQIYPLLEFQMSDVHQHRAETKVLIERLAKYGIQVCVGNVSGSRDEVSLLGRIGVTLAKLSFNVVLNTDRAQLTEIVQSLQARGMAVVAPGIDDQETVARVWTCRPDFIQGNYLQSPSQELSFDFHRMSHDS
ncbi:EAL domain-containing protein [Thiorhodococcus mannitoliphagus]|uniref:EAL domain-containing protein n=1 Tax=Thiorhodococcus mannitoliphagus TaxID=329406 RepID=A0A6P1DZG3_9GAMM|nr:EAL domain-containing protein [Thiorhodococcus mannitoliphagus]NEX21552.1 EAL domain-containing protein [Thiorhodococcus mannitoliphagus]